MVKVLKLPVPVSQDADEFARADTERNQQLFAWADAVLKKLRLDKAVAAAKSIEELRSVTFKADSAEVTLAIRDALHPADGQRQEHFRGLREGGLKLILKNRFAELKKTREAILRRRKQPDWTDRLILDKDGKIVANLANLILILSEAPEWKGVLGYDEFNLQVVIVKAPSPLEKTGPNTPWTDHHESQCGFGSCTKVLVRRLAMSGARFRRRLDTTRSTRRGTISNRFTNPVFGMARAAGSSGCKRTSTSKTANMFAQSDLDF
jgi:hypothetical protein